MKKLLILIIILLSAYFVAGKYYPEYLNKLWNKIPQKTDEMSNWKTLVVEPSPGVKFQIEYPIHWDASELRFPCANNDTILAVISPNRTDLKGYEGVSVAYLVQFCVRNEAILFFQGFVRASLSSQPDEQDKIVLPDGYLKTTDEYKLAKQIIATLGVVKTNYQNFNQ